MKAILYLMISFSSVLEYAWEISELVNIKQIDSTIITDIKYATKDNFTGQIIYSSSVCLVHKNTAHALQAVQNELRSLKLGLKIWDGYRSLAAQQKLWDVCALQYPDEKEREKYVVNPKDGGRHTRGTAVDVTLVDAKGNELLMPTGFDDFSPRAWTADTSCCAEAQKNRKLLHDIMRKHGFEPIKTEWWHFDLKGWQQYLPIKTDMNAA
ncbi:MAG: D-alanyl-D-alanine dipeptidase [Candidatus Babeliales bacterium]